MTRLFYLLFFSPLFAFAAQNTVMDLAKWAATIFNMVTALLITAAVAIFMWGSVRQMNSINKDPKKMREFMLYGVFIIFLAVSIWGVVRMLQNSIFV